MDRIILEERKKMLLEFICSKEYRPMKLNEMAGFLQVPRREKQDLRELLDDLMRDGSIVIDAKGRYMLRGADVLQGTFCGTGRGFGFITVEGQEEDIFVAETNTKGALHGDTVQFVILAEAVGDKRTEGRIVKILEHANDVMVGTFQKSKNFGFVLADNKKFNKDIYISKKESQGLVTGNKVLVKIVDYGNAEKNPQGKILEVLGHINDPGTDVISVVKSYGLPEQFPEDVMEEVRFVPDEVRSEDKSGRKDCRSWQTVTIDGEDAKDLDDAITLTKEGDLYRLGVHIADVSHYVREGNAFDKEALKRGTSIYLIDRVIPMLPHQLSNGICSLNAGTDRLALSCIMDVDRRGNVVNHEICETVIRVDRRMSYTSVKKILDGDESECREYEELVPLFEQMKELAEILQEKRRRRGSINFDFPESKITLDAKGRPLEIKAYERNEAHCIIEDFMLLANETVAEDYFWQDLPFVYRSHEAPDSDKMKQFAIFVNNFGYSLHLGKEEIHPKELQKLLGKLENSPEEAMISRVMLRSMRQAKYTTENLGHFGLSTKYYCHFTSPIRRYPDLQIHRIIKENLHGRLSEGRVRHYHDVLPGVAVQSSTLERRADEAEREVEKLKKVEYMSRRIGEVYEGVISGITNWGMYVELPNTIEGVVRVENMHDDYYLCDTDNYQMVGEHRRKVYKMGTPIRVRVEATDKLDRTIEFAIEQVV